MIQQTRQLACYRQTEPEPLAFLSRRIIQLGEFFENRIELGIGNTRTGIPYLEAECVGLTTTTDQNFTLIRVFDGVADQVLEYAVQQRPIAAGD